jgi:DGQHR domain-containing protein
MIRTRAVRVEQGKLTFYLIALNASQLWDVLTINQRVEAKDEGYQRVLSPGRVRAVSRYIESGGAVPGSVIVSFDKLNFSVESDELEIPDGETGWVIDGQHRLAGAHEAAQAGTDIILPVAAFAGLSFEAQVELFITINREAKNVPSSLYLDLLKHLPKKKSEKELTEERISDIARTLNNDEASPFFQRIIFTRTARAGEISLTNFARVLRPHLQKTGGTLSPFTQTEQVGVISNYYRALEMAFPTLAKADSSVLFRTVGFGGVWRAFPLVFSNALSRHKAASVSAFAKVLKQIAGFNFDDWTQYGTGTAAEGQAGDDMIASLQEALAADEEGGTGLKL